MTVAEFREWLLDGNTTSEMVRRASRGITSEIVAGVCKLMSNLDLIYAAKKIQVTAHCNTTIGLPGTFSSRLQPNHTTDDPKGILASAMEGDVYKRQLAAHAKALLLQHFQVLLRLDAAQPKGKHDIAGIVLRADKILRMIEMAQQAFHDFRLMHARFLRSVVVPAFDFLQFDGDARRVQVNAEFVSAFADGGFIV